jgi:hypothetical protein
MSDVSDETPYDAAVALVESLKQPNENLVQVVDRVGSAIVYALLALVDAVNDLDPRYR